MKKLIFLIASILLSTPQVANACTINSNSYQTINRQDWDRIKEITKNIYQKPVYKTQIDAILSPISQCKSSADGRIETCKWIGGQKCSQKIKAQFRDRQLIKISKSGF